MAASLAVIVFGTAIELVGIGTGFPFGRYHYTDTWWPTVRIGSLGFFPISLPFAWLMIASACAFTFRLSGSKLLDALMAGSAACLLDLLMESTLAGKLGYWTWDLPGPLPGRAPWSNSFAWFGISFLAALILYLPDRSPAPSKGPFQVLAGQTLLMAALLFL
jgi:putative membrane protein